LPQTRKQPSKYHECGIILIQHFAKKRWRVFRVSCG
jgi:hypothetical protein